MEMVMSNGFSEMSNEEMLIVDGGGWKTAVVVGAATLAVVAIGVAPVVGVAAVVYGGASTTVAIGTALGCAGAGCTTLGAISHKYGN